MPAPLYPLTHPTAPGFRDVRFRQITNVGVTESERTGYQQVQVWDYDKWGATVSLPPMTMEQAGLWQSFFLRLHGREGTFYLTDVSQPPSLTVNGTLRANVPQGSYDLSVQLPTGTTGAVRAGEYVQIGSGAASKLYQITEPAVISSANRLTVGIWPRLKVAATSGAVINFSNPRGVFRMKRNDVTWNANQSYRSQSTFVCEEAE